MSFWSPRRVEFCSRVVEARAPEGVLLRAKLTIVFHDARPEREAEVAVARYVELVVHALESRPMGAPLSERALSVQLMARPDVKRQLRRLDVTGLHEVGSGIRQVTTGYPDSIPVPASSRRR